MRMWMINPKFMCRQHLLGEHLELHMLVSHINKGYKIDGFINNDLLEPLSLQFRHEQLVKEMINRGYKHNSPFPLPFLYIKNFTNDQLTHKINVDNSMKELFNRCIECKKRKEENYEQHT